MKKAEVKVGGRYIAKVSAGLTVVRLTGESRFGGWDAVNEKTGRAVRIKTAAKLRRAATSPSVGISTRSQECRDCGKAFPYSEDADRCPECVEENEAPYFDPSTGDEFATFGDALQSRRPFVHRETGATIEGIPA